MKNKASKVKLSVVGFAFAASALATAAAVKDALRLTFDRAFSKVSLNVAQVGTAFAVQLKREAFGFGLLFR